MVAGIIAVIAVEERVGVCCRCFESPLDLLQLKTQGGLPKGFFTQRMRLEGGLELEFSSFDVILLGFYSCSCCSSLLG